MRLKESQTLWGIPIVHLREYSKKYRLLTLLLYLFDIIVVVGLTYYMYNKQVSYNTYGFVIVGVCLGVHFITYSFLNPEKWEAFKFYKRHLNDKLIKKTYSVDETRLYSVLYCIAYKRLRQGKSIETYKEFMLSACCENVSNSKSIMKYLRKYEAIDGNLTCYIIQHGKKEFFVGFPNDIEVVEIDEDEDND